VKDAAVHANAGYLVWRLSTKWRAAVDRALAPMGLTHAQSSLLASLFALSRGGTQPSQRELADFTGLDAMYVSKLARALQRGGFIVRTTHSADPRAVQLSLTEAGVKVIGEAVDVVQALQEHLTRPLGGSRGARTAELVAMLRQLLDQPPVLPADDEE
jgi:DNA-binding MarR family transcriptional regulator